MTDTSITLTIKMTNSERSEFTVSIVASSKVSEFKKSLFFEGNVVIPPQEQRLIYKGRVLRDDLIIESYGLNSSK